MTRVTKELRQDYERMDSTWPDPLPPLTFQEAKLAVRRLVKKFRPMWDVKFKFTETSGNRRNEWWLGGGFYLNPERGWRSLVHFLSHRLEGGHNDDHLSMEWAMIKYVRGKGWLDGNLKREPKPEAPKLSLTERRAAKARRFKERAERELRAAEKRLRKWTRKVRYYEQRAI